MLQVVDDPRLAGDEAAEARERLAEGAEEQVHLGLDALGRGRSPPLRTEDPDAVRVVYVEAKPVPAPQLAQALEVGDAPGHREDRVGDHQGVLPFAAPGELALEVIEVLVDADRAAPDARALDEARVVLGVGEDDAVGALREQTDAAQVREEAGREDDGRFFVRELGELALEPLVKVEIAVQQARAGAARAVLVDGLVRGLEHLGVMRQPEVVVRAEHDDLAPLHRDDGPFGRGERVEEGVDAGGFDQLGVLEGEAGLEDVHSRGLSPGNLCKAGREYRQCPWASNATRAPGNDRVQRRTVPRSSTLLALVATVGDRILAAGRHRPNRA